MKNKFGTFDEIMISCNFVVFSCVFVKHIVKEKIILYFLGERRDFNGS